MTGRSVLHNGHAAHRVGDRGQLVVGIVGIVGGKTPLVLDRSNVAVVIVGVLYCGAICMDPLGGTAQGVVFIPGLEAHGVGLAGEVPVGIVNGGLLPVHGVGGPHQLPDGIVNKPCLVAHWCGDRG